LRSDPLASTIVIFLFGNVVAISVAISTPTNPKEKGCHNY